MAKTKNALDFSNMFAKVDPVQPEEKKEPVKPSSEVAESNDEETVPTTKAVEPEKAVKPSKKSESKTNRKSVRCGKAVTTLTISADVWEDYQYLMKILNKSVSGRVEEFMRSEVKKNADLIAAVKDLRNK